MRQCTAKHHSNTYAASLRYLSPQVRLSLRALAAEEGGGSSGLVALRICAETDDQYVERALSLASDPKALASLRTGLRERFATSPVCDAPAFAARFGAALADLHATRTRR